MDNEKKPCCCCGTPAQPEAATAPAIDASAGASFPTCKRIWIHADLVSCWRCVQASESVNSVRCVGNTFLQEIKQSKL